MARSERVVSEGESIGRNLDISVLIATHNRAEILRETLVAMCRLERTGLSVEFVIVDNNCTDNTKDVVQSFAERMPIRHLYERSPGKNCALNKALATVELGQIVAFTDDDITPQPDWLVQIAGACDRWPDHAVFGGCIRPRWPGDGPPAWARFRWIQVFGYALHDLEGVERLYDDGAMPFGGNFWVRRSVFESGRRYDEAVGPRPMNRIMGSETTFLAGLRREAYEMVWCPKAVVLHRIMPQELSVERIRRRAFTAGRGQVHLEGIARPQLLSNSPRLWLLCEGALLLLSLARYALVHLRPNATRRIHGCIGSARVLGYHWESMKQRRLLGPSQGMVS